MTTEMWLFAQFILQTLDGFTTGLMMELSLEKRNCTLRSRLGRVLCYYTLVFLICLPSWLMHYKVLPTINLLFTIAGTIFLTMKLYGASFRQAVTLFGFYLLIGCFAELALAYFYPLAFEMQVDWTKDVMFEPLFTTMLLVSVLKIVFALLYRMMGQDRAERSIFPILYGINLVLFVLLLIPLYMFFTSQSHASPQEVTRNLVIYFGFFTSILLFSAVVFRTQHIQDTKSLDHARVYAELQNQYYTSLEKNSQAQARLFHDYKNVITACRGLLLQNQAEEARGILQEFSCRLQKTALAQSDPSRVLVISGMEYPEETGRQEKEEKDACPEVIQ